MKIKRIEISGFKSFMEKTVLSFQKGVTAVVGPNGCGKSNIVDAIRWVLGEQSAKQLRGRSMEEVIFSGSSVFHPLGMAEVTMVFTNENGDHGAELSEFSEIEVCRRIFRSGESEYSLNKVPCRRKDIRELFMDTGVGNKAYSIVEQDRIAMVINSKPEERRLFIEEAAGISKYKSRRESAQRKIESTRQNLVRINDIRKEVERQMKGLERQAKQAEKYKSLREKCHKLEVTQRSRQYRHLENERLKVQENLIEFNTKGEDLATEINEKALRLETLRISLLEKEKEINETQENLYRIGTDIQKKESRIEYAEPELDRLKEFDNKGKNELTQLNQRLSRAKKEEGELSDECRLGEAILQIEESELAEKEKASEERKRELIDIQGALNQEKTQLIEDLTQKAALKNASLNFEKEREGFYISKEKIERENLDAAEKYEQIEKEITDLNETLKQWAQEWEDLEGEKKKRWEYHQEINHSLEEKKAQFEKFRAEFNRKESRLLSLTELQENYEGYRLGVRDLMLAQKAGSFLMEGVFRILTEIIDVPPEYETVVECLLGERLQSIVVEKERQGINAIEFLKSQSSGRNSFILMNLKGNDPVGRAEHNNDRSVIPLRDVIGVEPGFERIGNFLFGDVLVVPDLDKALELWQGNGCKETFITLEGDTIQPPGILAGGGQTKDGQGLLRRFREIKELEEEIKTLRSEICRRDEELNRLSGEVQKAYEEGEILSQKIQQKGFEMESLENERRRKKEELQGWGRRKEVLFMEAEQINGELIGLEAGERANSEKLLEIEERANARQEKIETIQERHRLTEEELRDLSEEMTQKRIQMASMKERVEHQHQNLNRLEDLQKELQSRITSLFSELEEADREKDRIEQLIVDLKEELMAFSQEHQKIRERLEGEKEQHRHLSDQIQQLETLYQNVRDERNALDDKINGLKLEDQQIRLKMDHLKEELRERFGLEEIEPASESELSPEDDEAMKERLLELKMAIERIGEVNLMAIEDYEELEKRHRFLADQQSDLLRAIKTLQKAIVRINRNSRRRFLKTFEAIDMRFKEVFPRLFSGGEAALVITSEGDVLESGIDIVAQPPGKKLQNLQLLSGGEKALTAVALLFSILLIKPSPFCLFDEVDAPLDDVNIDRFVNLVKELSTDSQFILVTHNKRTMEIADTLYGITMENPGVSKLMSVKLNQQMDHQLQ
jgi:chromosome segregation protein